MAGAELMVKIIYPSLELLQLYLRREEQAFNEALVTALTWHKEYWTANEARSLSGDGLVALARLAIACMASDADMLIDVESEYSPSTCCGAPGSVSSPRESCGDSPPLSHGEPPEVGLAVLQEEERARCASEMTAELRHHPDLAASMPSSVRRLGPLGRGAGHRGQLMLEGHGMWKALNPREIYELRQLLATMGKKGSRLAPAPSERPPDRAVDQASLSAGAGLRCRTPEGAARRRATRRRRSIPRRGSR
ncbi:immunity 49 family protein [Streptomyces niveus]|uniref:immunity 49 family protein n=1 Tax=Streptomyces niveus TaxID=193462 RepID=UPI003419EA62